MTTQAYSQRHLISVAELASAIATARGTAGIDELRELARQAEGGLLATLPLYPPHQRWQHRGDVNRIGVPTENPVVIWRMLAAKVCKPHLSDKDAFNYPPAASTWHMLAADVYGLGMTRSLNRRAAAALRELAIRYSPELGDDEAELLKPVTGPAEPVAEPGSRVVPVTQPECIGSTQDRRYTRTGWKDGPAFDYVAKQFAEHGPFQAKALIASLKKTNDPGSPFEVRGGVLTVSATGQTIQDKTIENSMVAIRERADKLKAFQG